MSKFKISALILVLLCLLPVLAGCGKDPVDNEPDYLLIAENKTTQFKLVNYLEDNTPVRKLMADLLIKTGAPFQFATQANAGEHAIYIGTSDQLSSLGKTRSDLTFTKYEIRVDNGNLYICLGMEEIAEDVCAIVKNLIKKTQSGAFGIESATSIVADITGISEIVPTFDTKSGQVQPLHDCGSNNYMISYTSMKNADVLDEIAAYEKKMAEAGYSLYQENEIGENRFVTYMKGDTMIHCNYFAAMREYRIIYGPVTHKYNAKPVTNYEKLAEPSVSIIKGTENVLCMVIQLADGSFYVIDGGWGDSGMQSKTLNAGEANEMVMEYYRDVEKDMEVLYQFMKDRTPGGGKPQVHWMITHADPDHILLPNRFIREYADKFDLKTAIYNFPNLYNIGLGESGGSTNDPMVMTSYAEAFLNAVNECFPDTPHYVYHTGDKVYLPGGELEFLFAPEDYWPNKMPWMNHTSGVWRFTIDGKTVLITGDAEKGLCNQMSGVYGDYLKSDVLQVNHHGANGATLGFYKLIEPTVCFWACQQYHLDYDNRQLGYKTGYEYNRYLRTKEDVIGHFSNSETHTVLLPSLEVE